MVKLVVRVPVVWIFGDCYLGTAPGSQTLVELQLYPICNYSFWAHFVLGVGFFEGAL